MSKTSKLVGLLGLAVLVVAASPHAAAAEAVPDDPTFSRDIAPILQRSCQKCHRPQALAPMSLISYEEVRPWARAIKYRTGLRDKPGVMPPWYIEKNIGIQRFKDDWSLSDAEIATIARWADNRAPQGDPADMPPPPPFIDVDDWEIGEPDLVVSSPPFEVPGSAPDWWGSLGQSPSGLTEDRYVAAIEYKERNDLDRSVRSDTVGGLFVVHHSALYTMAEGDDPAAATIWPVHEVGRNADVFDERAGRLLAAGSTLLFPSTHLHSNGTDTRAHIDVAFKFHPRGYEPEKQMELLFVGNGPDSTSARWSPTSAPTPTSHCRRTPRSASSSRTCTRRACGCAWKRCGARPSRRSTAPATTTTGCASTSTPTTRRRCCRRDDPAPDRLLRQTRRPTRTWSIRATGPARATARSTTCSST